MTASKRMKVTYSSTRPQSYSYGGHNGERNRLGLRPMHVTEKSTIFSCCFFKRNICCLCWLFVRRIVWEKQSGRTEGNLAIIYIYVCVCVCVCEFSISFLVWHMVAFRDFSQLHFWAVTPELQRNFKVQWLEHYDTGMLFNIIITFSFLVSHIRVPCLTHHNFSG
jgi:hypothetical protein